MRRSTTWATCKRAQQLSTILWVVSQQCCVRLHGAKSLAFTGFKLCATTFNNMQQGVQTYATFNIQQCWGLLINNVASVCMQPQAHQYWKRTASKNAIRFNFILYYPFFSWITNISCSQVKAKRKIWFILTIKQFIHIGLGIALEKTVTLL